MPSSVKVPFSAISFAARMKPPQAARASEPPTLMRRTPRSAASCKDRPDAPISRLNGFGCDRLHHRRDVLARLQARRVETVGSGIGVSGKPVDDELEVGHAPQIRLAPADQQRAAVADRLARGLDALDRERVLVERLVLVAGGILDREAGDAGAHTALDIVRDLVRLDGKAALEIRIHGDVDGRAQCCQMLTDVVDRDVVVGLADGPGKARAR